MGGCLDGVTLTVRKWRRKDICNKLSALVRKLKKDDIIDCVENIILLIFTFILNTTRYDFDTIDRNIFSHLLYNNNNNKLQKIRFVVKHKTILLSTYFHSFYLIETNSFSPLFTLLSIFFLFHSLTSLTPSKQSMPLHF